MNFAQNEENIPWWRMFISIYLRNWSETDEILDSWKCVSLIGDERVDNLQRMNVSFQILCLGKIFEIPIERWNKDWDGSNHFWNAETLTVMVNQDTLQQNEEIENLLDILCGSKKMLKNAVQMRISFPHMQRDFEQDTGHLLVLALKRSGVHQWR